MQTKDAISLRTIATQTLSFVRAERDLLMPVALATSGVAVMGNVLTASPEGPSRFFIIAFALNLMGQLAINALTLGKGRSVAEAMTLSVTRLPKALGAVVLIGIGLALLLLPATLLLQKLGTDLLAVPPVISAPAMLLIVALSILITWFGARISLFAPLIVDRDVSMAAALRQSFSATQAVGAKLFLFTIAAGAVYLFVSSLIDMIGGALLGWLALAVGLPGVATGLLAAALGIWGAIFGIYSSVFQALLYRALMDAPKSGI